MLRRAVPHRRTLWARLRKSRHGRMVPATETLHPADISNSAKSISSGSSRGSDLPPPVDLPPPTDSNPVPQVIPEFRVAQERDGESSDRKSYGSSSEEDEYLQQPLQQIAARYRMEGRKFPGPIETKDSFGTHNFGPPEHSGKIVRFADVQRSLAPLPTPLGAGDWLPVGTDIPAISKIGTAGRQDPIVGEQYKRGAAPDPQASDDEITWEALKETGMYIANGMADWMVTMLTPSKTTVMAARSPLDLFIARPNIQSDFSSMHTVPSFNMHTNSHILGMRTVPDAMQSNTNFGMHPAIPESPKLPPPGDPLAFLIGKLADVLNMATYQFGCAGPPDDDGELACQSEASNDSIVEFVSPPAHDGTFPLQLPDPHVKDILGDTWSYVYHSHIEITMHKACDMERITTIFIVAGEIKFRIPGFYIDRIQIPIRNNWRVMVVIIGTSHAANENIRKWYHLDLPLGSLGDDIVSHPIAFMECPDPGPFGAIDGVALCDLRDCDEAGAAFHTLRYRGEHSPPVARIVMTIRRQLQGLHMYTHIPDWLSVHSSGGCKIYTGLFCDEVDSALSCEFATTPEQLEVVDCVLYQKPGFYVINKTFAILIFFGFVPGQEDRQLLVFEGGSIQPVRDWFLGTGENVQWVNIENREDLIAREAAICSTVPKCEQTDFSASTVPWECTVDAQKANEFAMFQAAITERENIQWLMALELPTPDPSYASYLNSPHYFRLCPTGPPVEMTFVRDPQRRRMFRLLPVQQRTESNLWNNHRSTLLPRSTN